MLCKASGLVISASHVTLSSSRRVEIHSKTRSEVNAWRTVKAQQKIKPQSTKKIRKVIKDVTICGASETSCEILKLPKAWMAKSQSCVYCTVVQLKDLKGCIGG